MSQHYDTLETRTPEEREQALMRALPQQIAHAKANAPFFATWLKDVAPASVTSRAALAKLPVLRKSMLGEVQKKNPPMGGLIAVPMSKVRHVFMSPGPIFEVDTDEPDTAENSAEAPTLVCSRPPGSRPSHSAIAPYILSVAPERTRISPSRRTRTDG